MLSDRHWDFRYPVGWSVRHNYALWTSTPSLADISLRKRRHLEDAKKEYIYTCGPPRYASFGYCGALHT